MRHSDYPYLSWRLTASTGLFSYVAGTMIFAFLQLAVGKPFQVLALSLILLPQLSTNLMPTWGQLALISVQLAPFVVSDCWLVSGVFRVNQAAQVGRVSRVTVP
ncbi:hypothetical protein ID851_19190 [Xenorhabdus sp. 5]|nr:hypothetical protein [Xenorhabdus sp. 5]